MGENCIPSQGPQRTVALEGKEEEEKRKVKRRRRQERKK
jgi:hypothetical protein